jgi:cellulose synthase/poly-beta-1,6-N-acetylglucosamine synthase-like glycosyltransferase
VSESAELIAAVLEGLRFDEAQPEVVLAAAGELGVDPLDYCSHHFGLGSAEVLRRAAAWAGLAFSPVVPNTGGTHAAFHHIDGFATTRSIREPLYDRQVTYVAPDFEEVLHLKAYARRNPGIRRTTCLVPAPAIRTALARLSEEELLTESRQRLARRWPFALAHLDVGGAALTVFFATAALLTGLVAFAPLVATIVLLPLLTALLLVPSLMRLLAIFVPQEPARQIAAPPLADRDLPIYSVLVPLRDEAAMVPQLGRALRALDYPPEKLDVKFVVEAQSTATVAAVRKLLDDPRFELVTVPDARPRTKPKALDYALPFVRGKYVVVYDAEDMPDPDQLRLAAARFAAEPDIDCLQAGLMIDNGHENVLTSLFAGEYAGQFAVLMPALVRWGLPIPLGGTSNHFTARALREAGGWDAFNVTEDADLGVRLARLRYRTAMLASSTFEEAPIGFRAWLNQRTRWMKGWMQTYIVHNRRPGRLLADLGWRGFIGLELWLGSLILSPLLHTVFVASILLEVLATGELPFTPFDLKTGLELAIFIIGYGGSFAVTFIGLQRTGQRHLLLIQALLPLYWTLHSVATIRAGWQLVRRPHFWAKTPHGVTRVDRRRRVAAQPAHEFGPAAGPEPPAQG